MAHTAALPATVAVPPMEGVTLEQYSGVSAAIIEGFPLPAVLDSEGLDARAWPRVSLRWSQRLAKDGAGGPLATAYRDTLAFARGWLGRRVAPLDDDLGAWMGFLNAWSAHPAPFELLDQLEMSPSDVSRIQGAWAQRIENDEKLRAKAQEIAKKKPSAVPKVTVTRAELRPFPWTRKGAAVVVAEEPTLVKPKLSSSFIGDAFGLERYAALTAELGLAKKSGASVREVLAKQALDEAGFAALEVRWERRFATDPTLAQDCRRLVRYYEAKLEAGPKTAGGAEGIRMIPAPAPPPAVNALVGTALALNVPRGPALPFVEGAAASVVITAKPAEEAKVERPAARLGGTALAVDVPGKPALPFEGTQEARAKLAGTALAVDVPSKPALPFAEDASAAPGIAAALPEEVKVERPAAQLGGTALAVDVPQGPVTPFEGPKPKRNKLAELSFDLRASLERAKEEAPALTLEQHASMTVEIAMAPERAMEIVARYGLTAQGKRAVDGYWRERVGADAGVREAWERAYRTYWEWRMASRSGA